jgi:hypothetical protein
VARLSLPNSAYIENRYDSVFRLFSGPKARNVTARGEARRA